MEDKKKKRTERMKMGKYKNMEEHKEKGKMGKKHERMEKMMCKK